MTYGLLELGNDVKRQGEVGLANAARREHQREMVNQNAENANRQSRKAGYSTVAGYAGKHGYDYYKDTTNAAKDVVDAGNQASPGDIANALEGGEQVAANAGELANGQEIASALDAGEAVEAANQVKEAAEVAETAQTAAEVAEAAQTAKDVAQVAETAQTAAEVAEAAEATTTAVELANTVSTAGTAAEAASAGAAAGPWGALASVAVSVLARELFG
ncbi:hypothetical protein J7384_17765 [Endozoicomonas sp. G2_1]|uniref:hypothetical protein n=1 Tax=Endozoicomonas sp. G2_1 TaxID=2821091 RepID=UPI001ADB4D90|nr:hypothetical protein [Endozoicomonas sp. G2_1]MBO9492213.1 hypothetical protein [Endozoicomonas sp. G2_1]